MENEVKTVEDPERIITKAHEAQTIYATYTQEQVDKIFRVVDQFVFTIWNWHFFER